MFLDVDGNIFFSSLSVTILFDEFFRCDRRRLRPDFERPELQCDFGSES